jgi:hypothetical protein
MWMFVGGFLAGAAVATIAAAFVIADYFGRKPQ